MMKVGEQCGCQGQKLTTSMLKVQQKHSNAPKLHRKSKLKSRAYGRLLIQFEWKEMVFFCWQRCNWNESKDFAQKTHPFSLVFYRKCHFFQRALCALCIISDCVINEIDCKNHTSKSGKRKKERQREREKPLHSIRMLFVWLICYVWTFVDDHVSGKLNTCYRKLVLCNRNQNEVFLISYNFHIKIRFRLKSFEKKVQKFSNGKSD